MKQDGGRAVGALGTRPVLQQLPARAGKCCVVLCFFFCCFFFLSLIGISTTFSPVFQLSPCVYVLGKNEWLDLMRGG